LQDSPSDQTATEQLKDRENRTVEDCNDPLTTQNKSVFVLTVAESVPPLVNCANSSMSEMTYYLVKLYTITVNRRCCKTMCIPKRNMKIIPVLEINYTFNVLTMMVGGWHSGNIVCRINEITVYRAQLVPG